MKIFAIGWEPERKSEGCGVRHGRSERRRLSGSELIALLLLCNSCAPSFDGFHFDAADASTSSSDGGSSSVDAGELADSATSSGAYDAGGGSAGSSSVDAGASMDAGAVDAAGPQDAGEHDGSTGMDASAPHDAGTDAGKPDCGVLDTTCHGCASPTHWCPFIRACGLPSQC